MFVCESLHTDITPTCARPCSDSCLHLSAWLSAHVFSERFLQVVQYLCRYKPSHGCSFAQECLYVLLISLLNVKHSMVSFALWHMNDSLCKRAWSDLKADGGAQLNSTKLIPTESVYAAVAFYKLAASCKYHINITY